MVSGTDRRPLAGRRAYLLPLVFASAGFLSLLLINVFLEPFHSPTSHSLPLDDPLLEYAHKLSRSIDPHTSPCTDFYQYACGNWASQFSLTDQVEHLDYGILLTRQTNRQLRERFKTVGESLSQTDSRVVRYVVQLYGECIDEKQRSKLGVRPVAEQVRKLVGEWPILVERDTVKTLSDPRWMDLLVDFFLVDIHPVVAITFELNALDAHEKILKISKPDVLPFGLPKKYNENNLRDRFFQAVKQLMGRVFPYSEQQRTQVETAIHEMIAFELKLANYSGKSQTHMMSLGLLKRRTGHLMDWTQLLNRFAAKAQATVRFTDQSKVVVRDLPYLHHLGTVLSVTPLRTVKNFLAWILVYQHQYLLDSETRQGWPNGGQDSSRNLPTWKACLNLLHKSNLFTLAISQLYLRQQNGNQTDLWRIKETVSGIIDHLVVAYEATFHQSNSGIWLDAETARRALVKLRALKKLAAFPDWLLTNSSQLDGRYQMDTYGGTEVVKGHFYRSYLQWVTRDLSVRFGNFGRRQTLHWYKHFNDINAYFFQLKNLIFVPLAILQPPFFHLAYPPAVNYASIGSILGHEIAHAFDWKGHLHDEHGNRANWWSEYSKAGFIERSQCFEAQYSNITEPISQLKLNGSRCLSENLADNGGLRTAFQAFQHYRRQSGTRASLPSQLASFTQEQLFFLAYAQIWCGYTTADYLRYSIGTDFHVPNKYRVNVPLGNQEAFSLAFDCPVGSPMNFPPANKCKLF